MTAYPLPNVDEHKEDVTLATLVKTYFKTIYENAKLEMVFEALRPKKETKEESEIESKDEKSSLK